MTRRKLKGDYLIKELFNNNFHIKNGDLKFISECIEYPEKVLVQDKYGICCTLKTSLLYGASPNIKSAVDKTSYCINKFKEVHGETYDYSIFKYNGCHKSSEIICKEHGKFSQMPLNHNKGRGCYKCGRKIIKKTNKDNPTGWSYSNWEKAGKKSKYFDSFKVYIIKCWNENEEFYKIGRTYLTVKRRFKNVNYPYSFKLVHQFIATSKEICILEKELHGLNKENKYFPKLKFNGESECFSKYIIK